jgi:hypothetical protein
LLTRLPEQIGTVFVRFYLGNVGNVGKNLGKCKGSELCPHHDYAYA